MRLLYMGTPEIAAPALTALLEAGYEVVGVVTQPDKPRGRGKNMQFPPVKERALAHGLRVYQPARVRDEEFLAEMERLKPDVVVVMAYGQILPQRFLDIPPYGCINIHASLLPKYRGAAPIQWAVIDGEENTGLTTMRMNGGLDTGDMIDRVTVLLEPGETGESLYDKLMELAGGLIVETLKKIEAGTARYEKQDDSQASYAKMLRKEMGRIDFTRSAQEIERLIRGLNPWPSAYTSLQGKTLKIWEAGVKEGKTAYAPGTVCSVASDSFCVQTGQGILEILEVQLEGKKRMGAGAFLRGYEIKSGELLG